MKEENIKRNAQIATGTTHLVGHLVHSHVLTDGPELVIREVAVPAHPLLAPDVPQHFRLVRVHLIDS